MRVDVIVLGAGIVGVSTALHLQMRGFDVALLDRSQPGEGASFGNAGLIERSSVIPAHFPRKLPLIAKYAFNRTPSVRFDPLYLLKAAPALVQYWRLSSSRNLKFAVSAMLPLIETSVDEHDALISHAGAQDLVKPDGWIGVWRDAANFAAFSRVIHELDRFNLSYTILDADQLSRVAPELNVGPAGAVGGVHWRDPKSVTDPGELVKRYAALFVRRGGLLLVGDAESLRRSAGTWSVDAAGGSAAAGHAVVALGPQSDGFVRRFGYRLPMLMKRGYHRHYRMHGAMPSHPIVDKENGFVLSPMTRGLRLTTGIEFAALNAPPNLEQLKEAEAAAAQLLPLGEPVEEAPWLGTRPCPPDMRPIIGPAPGTEGLWFNFGHAHHGLTIGPATGRLLAEMLAGKKTFTDPAPYSAARFS